MTAMKKDISEDQFRNMQSFGKIIYENDKRI